jgi:hypothetical protein
MCNFVNWRRIKILWRWQSSDYVISDTVSAICLVLHPVQYPNSTLSTLHSFTDGSNPDSWVFWYSKDRRLAPYIHTYTMSVYHYQCSQNHTASVAKSAGVTTSWQISLMQHKLTGMRSCLATWHAIKITEFNKNLINLNTTTWLPTFWGADSCYNFSSTADSRDITGITCLSITIYWDSLQLLSLSMANISKTPENMQNMIHST